MSEAKWPEPTPIEDCKVAIGEWVLVYLHVPQIGTGGWTTACRGPKGIWMTESGFVCAPRVFMELPPKLPREESTQ